MSLTLCFCSYITFFAQVTRWKKRTPQKQTADFIEFNCRNFKTHRFDFTHWKSSPAARLPFSSRPSGPLEETSQPQSHLPPLSPRLIHHITSLAETIVSMATGRRWLAGASLGVDCISCPRMKTCLQLRPDVAAGAQESSGGA